MRDDRSRAYLHHLLGSLQGCLCCSFRPLRRLLNLSWSFGCPQPQLCLAAPAIRHLGVAAPLAYSAAIPAYRAGPVLAGPAFAPALAAPLAYGAYGYGGAIIAVVAEEASVRCSRCPAVCTSAHTYQLSCHNACRSLSPRLTEVRCEGNRCMCREPATTTTTAASTTTKKRKIFG
ncbi:hypothetical protein Ocin01_11589 [Orchesella cincta]|uniref:Uncharacterized protein n=1 Tax=Orchesella cincta TaxID=48709 RepID=A0A1D2MQM9_ORCCI|nr:hypothetical protein Ocin01_11589 [Orchesella cincta]